MTTPAETEGRAFGGGILRGDRWVRIAYLDEAGLAGRDQEAFGVVSGIIIHGDKHWLALERHLAGMVKRLIRPDRQEGAIFHAKDIYHGTKAFPRDVYSMEERFAMLDELASLPNKFDLPVVSAAVSHAWVLETHPEFDAKRLVEHAHMIAFSVCLLEIEKYMQSSDAVEAGEVCSIVVEDNTQMRGEMRSVARYFKNAAAASHGSELLPLSRIVDTPHFEEKTAASLLQLADTCAFCVKRHAMGARDEMRFYEPIVKRMIAVSHEDAAAISAGELASDFHR